MYLKNLKLTNYRNYENLDLDFDRNLNLIIGDNGKGKTNLLESIYYISTGKSHRGAKQEELVRLGNDSAVMRALIEGNNEPEEENSSQHLIELQLSKTDNIKIRIDRAPYRRKSDFVSILPSVIFSPDDLMVIKGSPSVRREFIDGVIEKIDRDYQALGIKYLKILNQRNGLIKSIANSNLICATGDNSTLDIWNESLVRYGSEIVFKRMQLISEIREMFKGYMNEFFNSIHAGIFYIPSWDREINDYAPDNNDTEQISGHSSSELPAMEDVMLKFSENLRKNFQKEINYKTTITGPHRDNLSILFNNLDIKSFGSQGQQRIASVCLRLCELEILRKKLKKNPVLLLDDVLSELDRQREKRLLKIINKKFQIFITAANPDVVNYLDTGQMNRFIIENGNAHHI